MSVTTEGWLMYTTWDGAPSTPDFRSSELSAVSAQQGG
jgi:hypothetical protein